MPSIQQQLAQLDMTPEAGVQAASVSGDAFDGSAEPVIYLTENRTPAMGLELKEVLVYVIFSSLIISLLFILPGMRRTKVTSFLSLSTLLVMGASIFIGLTGTNWLTGVGKLRNTPYSALNGETLEQGQLRIMVGLMSVNVTLSGNLLELQTPSQKSIQRSTQSVIHYNERFEWDDPDRMAKEHLDALQKGLPFPILTVSEFLSQDAEGFQWGRRLRAAGYYTSMVLYTALASWCLTIAITCLVPSYLPRMVQITSALMMLSVWVYSCMIESPEMFNPNQRTLTMQFGFTYLALFFTSAYSLLVGILLFAINIANPNDQLTIMDSELYMKDRKTLYGTDSKWSEPSKKLSSTIANNSSGKDVSIQIDCGDGQTSATVTPVASC